jgi:hypothetical protein
VSIGRLGSVGGKGVEFAMGEQSRMKSGGRTVCLIMHV